MSWMNILGALAEELLSRPDTVSRATRPAPRPGSGEAPPNEEIARAEAETKRMLDEARREMVKEFVAAEMVPWRERIESTDSRVLDVEAKVVSGADSLDRALDEVESNARAIEGLERKLKVLIVLVGVLAVAAVAALVRSF